MSWFSLKLIALILMFGEHFVTFFPNTFSPEINIVIMYLGRIVAAIFFFLAVEWYHKTSSKIRYLVRLFSWAWIMFVWDYLVTNFTWAVVWRDIHPLWNNIFLSIAMWVSMIWSIDAVRNFWRTDRKKSIIFGFLTFIIICASAFTEASIYGILMFLVFYFSYWNKKILAISYSILCVFVFWLESGAPQEYAILYMNIQWAMILALPLMLLYNWQKGKYSLKYLFYVFYPAHLWLLYFLSEFYK